MTPRPLTSRRAYDVLAMGRSSIDLYAHEIGRADDRRARASTRYVGGCPTNVSVGTRRLGLRSALLTAVGDGSGRRVRHRTSSIASTVDTRFIPRKPGRRTSAVHPDDPAAGQVSAHLLSRQLRRPRTDDRRRRRGRRSATAACVLLTGTGLSHEPSRARRCTRRRAGARAPACRSIVDIDYRAGSMGRRRQRSPPQMQAAAALRRTLAVGTEEEARGGGRRRDRHRSGGGHDPRLRHRSADSEARRRAGRRCSAPRIAPTDVAPFPVEVLNVLGAGDAFASGFIYGLPAGLDAASARRAWATPRGAIVVTRHGCANFMPTLDRGRRVRRRAGRIAI